MDVRIRAIQYIVLVLSITTLCTTGCKSIGAKVPKLAFWTGDDAPPVDKLVDRDTIESPADVYTPGSAEGYASPESGIAKTQSGRPYALTKGGDPGFDSPGKSGLANTGYGSEDSYNSTASLNQPSFNAPSFEEAKKPSDDFGGSGMTSSKGTFNSNVGNNYKGAESGFSNDFSSKAGNEMASQELNSQGAATGLKLPQGFGASNENTSNENTPIAPTASSVAGNQFKMPSQKSQNSSTVQRASTSYDGTYMSNAGEVESSVSGQYEIPSYEPQGLNTPIKMASAPAKSSTSMQPTTTAAAPEVPKYPTTRYGEFLPKSQVATTPKQMPSQVQQASAVNANAGFSNVFNANVGYAPGSTKSGVSRADYNQQACPADCTDDCCKLK